MAGNLEQTKISIENNIKMLTLAERESKRLSARKNIVNLRNVKPISRKSKMQEIMTEKDEEASDIDAYAEQL